MDKMSLNDVDFAGERFFPHNPTLKGPSKAQFEKVFSAGRSVNSLYFRIVALPGSGKVGIATSKSIGCHAQRNKIKRRVKVIVQFHQAILSNSFDWVFVVKKSASELSFDQLKENLCTSLETAKLKLAGGPPEKRPESF